MTTVRDYLISLQANICSALQKFEPQKIFITDTWEHASGGGGKACVLEDGITLERCGVNFSHVHGNALPPSATLTRPELKSAAFTAMGVSLVIHPRNPHAPTAHANVRYFEAQTPDGDTVWWFGGGFDLTPHYGYEEDAIHWHSVARNACKPFGEDIYAECKTACDRYFFLKHRQHCRGVGGLFFDDWQRGGFDSAFAFTQSIGDHFIPAYIPILQRRKDQSYTAIQRQWQLLRRGRYAEFNLIYDRGTLFGLQSGGRTESILVSMPPLASWAYCIQPIAGSPEADLEQHFLQPRNWLI